MQEQLEISSCSFLGLSLIYKVTKLLNICIGDFKINKLLTKK